jgi:hypothetical protein
MGLQDINYDSFFLHFYSVTVRIAKFVKSLLLVTKVTLVPNEYSSSTYEVMHFANVKAIWTDLKVKSVNKNFEDRSKKCSSRTKSVHFNCQQNNSR